MPSPQRDSKGAVVEGLTLLLPEAVPEVVTEGEGVSLGEFDTELL
jgi:hypothetical protein